MITILPLALAMLAPLVRLPAATAAGSIDLEGRLRAHVRNYAVTGDNFVEALILVAGEYKVPMGVEWIWTPAAAQRVHFFWKDATLRRVIEDVAHTQPGYRVEIEKPVVHVYPGNRLPSRENFLLLRIRRFGVRNQVVEIASKRLAELARAQMVPPETAMRVPGRGGRGFSQAFEVGDPAISVSLRDVAVKDALDALSLNSPAKIWLVTLAANRSLTRAGLWRTVSFSTGRAVPDRDQPVWELLRWGRPPY